MSAKADPLLSAGAPADPAVLVARELAAMRQRLGDQPGDASRLLDAVESVLARCAAAKPLPPMMIRLLDAGDVVTDLSAHITTPRPLPDSPAA